MAQIKYIGFYYRDFGGVYNRNHSPAAVGKMEYVTEVVSEVCGEAIIVSPSWIIDATAPYVRSKCFESGKNMRVLFGPSFGTKTKLGLWLKIIYSLLWITFWLINNTKRNEKIIVYHTPWLCLPLLLAKRIRRLRIVLEIEEIYQDVSSINALFRFFENILIGSGDEFILATELLEKKIPNGRKSIILYGSYKSMPQLSKPSDDGKIHLLYAGVIDTKKAGAYNAASAAEYLPEKYILHILGFGEVSEFLRFIEEKNGSNRNKCKIQFDGLKSDRDYIAFCQTCHIGLNTQKMTGDYVNSSFPSKILSYLSMGIRVVAGDIEVVRQSKIEHLVRLYSEDNPAEIAKAILKVNLNHHFDGSNFLSELDIEFRNAIRQMFIIST